MKKALKIFIEIAIVAVVLLVAIYGYSKINPSFLSGNDLKDVKLTIEFKQSKKELLNKLEVGQTVFENTQTTLFGEIISADPVENAIVQVSDYENGKFVERETEEYGRRTIVVQGKAQVSETAVKFGTISVKTGAKYGLVFDGNIADGNIMKIEILD